MHLCILELCSLFLSSLCFFTASAPSPPFFSSKDGFAYLHRLFFWTPTGSAETAFLSATLTLSNSGAAVQQLDTLGSVQTKVSLVVFDSRLMIDGCRTQAVSFRVHSEQEVTEQFQRAEIFVLA